MYKTHSITKQPLISVIIPVWNPGPGIDRCINSLRGQTLKNIEMIFVDDRGTDDAMDKVREAAKEDPRIHILENPENIGAGASRNRGIEAAKGEYLSFVDPDDYIADDFYDLLYKEAVSSKADIAKGICIYQKEDGIFVRRPFRLVDVIRKQIKKGMPLYTSFTYEHWSAIYHRRLFADGEARYGTTRHDQDTLFLLRVCSKTEKIVLCEKAKYFFCCRSDSAMHRELADGGNDMAMAFEALANFFSNSYSNDEHACVYIANKLNQYLPRYYAYRKLSHLKKGYPDFLERIRISVRHLPFSTMLRAVSFPIMVLSDYGICLPDNVYCLPWDKKSLSAYFDLATAYFRFALTHPQFTLKCGLQLIRLLRNIYQEIKNRSLVL